MEATIHLLAHNVSLSRRPEFDRI